MDIPQVPQRVPPQDRRRAITWLMISLILLALSIFLVVSERSPVLIIMITIGCGFYSGYLFYKLYRR